MDYQNVWGGHFINGQWIKQSSGTQWQSVNPSTGKHLLTVFSHKQNTLDAISSAESFYKLANTTSWDQRIGQIQRLSLAIQESKELLLEAYKIEVGKPHWEAVLEFNACMEYLNWVNSNADFIRSHLFGPARLGHLQGQFEAVPAGVSLGYLAFSNPLTNFIFYTVAALQANCPIIIFTSRQNLVTGSILAKIVEKSEPEAGQIQMIFAGFSDFKQSLADKRISAVLYTGSREHCDEIRTDSRPFPERRHILQSGGKNAAIVDPTANMSNAVKHIATGAFRSTGQLCSSTNRVFVHEDVFTKFKSEMKNCLEKLNIGPTDRDTSPFMGPLYSAKSHERFLKFQTMAAREASETLQWGKSLEHLPGGFFVRPGVHIMQNFDEVSAYQKTVILGPDIAVYPYGKTEVAIDWANRTNASFALGWHGDTKIIERYFNQIYAPNVLLNLPTTELDVCLPLAGRYSSGFHRFHGPSIAHYLLSPQVIQSSDQMAKKLAEIPPVDC